MINHRVQKYIEDHFFCSEYLFRDWEAFLDFIYEEGCRVSSILWWEHCKKNFQHGYGGYSDPDDREWMYSETWLNEDGFEEKSLQPLQHSRNLLKKDLSSGKDPEEVHFTFVLTANNYRPNEERLG